MSVSGPASKTTQKQPTTQVLLISNNDKLAASVRQILPDSCQLVVEADIGRSRERIRHTPAIPVVAEFTPGQADSNGLSLLLHGHSSNNTVLIANGSDQDNLGFLFEHPGLLNMLPANFPNFDQELKTTLVKKFGPKTKWGISPYLKPGATIEKLRLYSFSNHGTILMTLSQHLGQLKAFRAFPDRIQTIATELMMNAVLDAPPQENVRNHRRKLHQRNQGIKLAKSEEVHVEFGYDDERFVISAADNHGMLKEADALQRLYRCSTLGGSQMRMTENRGAGVGFFMMYTWCSQLAFNILPGKRTEVICILPIVKREKFALPEARALNFYRGRSL